MKYKVKDTEKGKVKSEKWKAEVKNESHVHVGRVVNSVELIV